MDGTRSTSPADETGPRSTELPSREDSVARRVADQLARQYEARIRAVASGEHPLATPARPARPLRCRPQVVVIGVSTGGPEALASLLPGLPADLPVPILIVQHMPPVFTRQLARRLDLGSPLAVTEAEDGRVVRPGEAVVAPGGRHLVAGRSGFDVAVATHRGPPENSCRPSADVLFRAAAEAFGPATLAVVMTGMGQDGLLGARAIRQAGGQVLAQDEASSVVWGMPGYVARAGLADRVVHLDDLAAEIVRRARGACPRAD